MKKIFIIILVIIFPFIAMSQNCNNGNTRWQWKTHSNWFFGSGVFAKFQNGNTAPTFNLNNITNNFSTIVGYEGTSTLSDEQGNLLYYTGGRRLFDKLNALKYSGLLAGNENGQTPSNPGGISTSAVQGVLMVKHPKSQNIVYIFTTDDALTSQTYGLNFWTLNITTGVISAPTRLGNYRTTEQLDATFHSNDTDIWISTRESGLVNKNNYTNIYSYLLKSNTLESTPIISSVAPAVNTGEYFSSDWERGALKFSWDGSKAATVNDITGWGNFDDAIAIYDFNNTTGVFSNTKSVSGIWAGYGWNGNTYNAAYDCEFTPDSKGLYVCFTGNTNLIWLDASKSSSNLIYQSIKTVSNTASNSCDIKLGGDGKIYQTTTNSNVKVFTASDLNLGIGINYSTVNLPSGQTSGRGFSNMFIASYIPDITVTGGTMCNGGAGVNLNVNGGETNSTYTWSPNSNLTSNTIKNPIATPTTSTLYSVNVTTQSGCTIIGNTNVTVNPKPSISISSSKGNMVCNGDTVILTGTAGLNSYSWSPNTNNITQNSLITPPLNNTTYTLTASNSFGCSNSTTFILTVNPKPSFVITSSKDSICEGENINLSTANNLVTYNWFPSNIFNNNTIYNPIATPVQTFTEIILEATNSFGCKNTAKKNIYLKNIEKPSFSLQEVICIDNASGLNLTGIPSGGIFTENGVNINSYLSYNIAGNRTIKYTINKNGCTGSVEKTTTIFEKPTINWGEIPTTLCNSSVPISLSANPVGGIFEGNNVIGNSFIPSQTGSNIIKYSYFYGRGCVASFNKEIIVNTNTNLSITLNSAPNTLCEGTPITFSSISSVSNVKYEWYLNNNLLENSDKNIVLNGLKNNDIIKCKINIIDANNICQSSNQFAEASQTLSLTKPIIGNLLISTNTSLPVESGTLVRFSATSNIIGQSEYTWRKNGLKIGNNSNLLETTLNNLDEISCSTIPTSEGCYTNNIIYSNIIFNKIDIQYYELNLSILETPVIKRTSSGKIHFKFEENYKNDFIKFNLINSKKLNVLNSNIVSIPKEIGDNYITLDVSQLPIDSYILEVFTENNEIKYIKFK